MWWHNLQDLLHVQELRLGSLKFSVLRNMGGRKRRLLPGRRRLWSCSYLKPSIWYSSLWFLKQFEILKYISYNCWNSTTTSDKRSQFFSITVFHFIKIKNSFSADWLDTTSLRRLFSFVIFSIKTNKSIVTDFVITNTCSPRHVSEWLICTPRRFAAICNYRSSKFSLKIIASVEMTYPFSVSIRDATWYTPDFFFFS